MIPVFGKEGFAVWANLAKPIHDYLALAFVAGLVVMLLKFFRHSIPAKYDLQWMKQVGGYLDGSHPPAGFVNAGEKMFYWTLVFAGAGLVISGFWLLFPNLGFERAAIDPARHGADSSATSRTVSSCGPCPPRHAAPSLRGRSTTSRTRRSPRSCSRRSSPPTTPTSWSATRTAAATSCGAWRSRPRWFWSPSPHRSSAASPTTPASASGS